jgi:hypothetical protein
MSYTFRLRFKTSEKIKLPFDEQVIPVFKSGKVKIDLHAHQAEASIKKSTQLVIKGQGYDTVEAAQLEGELCRDRLTIAFSKLRFPADFGDRAAKGSWTSYGLKMLEEQSGTRVLNDIHGLQVYESNILVQFSTVSAKAFITKSRDETLKTLAAAFSINPIVHEKKRLAYELFSASSFADYVDARFMLLMMAVETLVQQNERENEEQELIDQLISCVNNSNIKNKDSIKGGLEGLRQESIGQAGKRLVSNLSNNYLDLIPERFFSFCYSLRSKLVHGHIPRPTFEEVGNVCGALENLVADLIAFPDL